MYKFLLKDFLCLWRRVVLLNSTKEFIKRYESHQLMKFNHILLILAVLTTSLLTLFISSYARAHVYYFIFGNFSLMLLIFLYNKEWKDVLTTSVLCLAFAIPYFIYQDSIPSVVALRTAAFTAFFFLHVVLLIGPWSRFSKHVRAWYGHRRHLGVTTFFLGLLHISLILPDYFQYSLTNTFSLIFTFYGALALFIMLWLGLTSWDYIQKKFTTTFWNVLHTVTMLLYVGMLIYLSKTQTIERIHWIFFGIFLAFWIVVAPYSIIKKIMNTKVFGWKQFHVLIYIAYASIMLHLYFGSLQVANIYLKTLYWGLLVLLVGSHLAGWIYRIIEDKKIKQHTLNKQITKNGKEYIGIANAKDFVEGQGEKFYLNNQPIAIFKHQGTFLTVSDICPHQKGPLHQGAIVNGYIECPWHQYQYSVKDGRGPPGFTDCVDCYETFEQNGVVYVATST